MRADLFLFCRVYRHTSQADGKRCYVELLFGDAEITSLPMYEHSGRIPPIPCTLSRRTSAVNIA